MPKIIGLNRAGIAVQDLAQARRYIHHFEVTTEVVTVGFEIWSGGNDHAHVAEHRLLDDACFVGAKEEPDA